MKVNSTAISTVRRSLRGETIVRFHSGDRYSLRIPRDKHRALKRARSVGTLYNREIRGRYEVHKLNA